MSKDHPPYSREAEEALLGSLIIDPDAIHEVADTLTPNDFYLEINRWIYEAILSMASRSESVDIVTLSEELRKKKRLDAVGGEMYLVMLVGATPTSINAKSYGEIIRRTSARRKMLTAASTIVNMAYDESGEVEEQIGMATAVVLDLDRGSSEGPVHDAKVAASRYMDYIEEASTMSGEITGLGTGFRELDMFLRGLQPTLYVLAARPGMGKSSFLINVAEHVAIEHGKRVLIFSLEMNSNQIVQRIVAHRTGINLQNLKSARLTEQQWRMVHAVIQDINDSGLYIDETAGIRPSQCLARAARLHAVEPLDLIIYDHLHLMTSDKYDGNPVKEVGEIAKRGFEIAKTLGVPSIMAAQLNRGVEDRKDKRPTLRDLRDSGEIEQNAYGIIFPYRDDYYYPGETDREGIAEINIAKNRDGPTGTIELLWHPGTASFNNIVRKVI